MHIVLVSLLDDPFDPPGHERFGGGQVSVFRIGLFLGRRGHRTTFITRLNAPEKKMEEKLGEYGEIFRIRVGPSMEVPLSRLSNYLDDAINELNRVATCLDQSPNIVHTTHWLSGSTIRQAGVWSDARHIHSVMSLGSQRIAEIGYVTDELKLRLLAETELYSAVDRLIVVTEFERNALIQAYPNLDVSRVVIIPHGVDIDDFHPRPASPGDYVCWSTSRYCKRD